MDIPRGRSYGVVAGDHGSIPVAAHRVDERVAVVDLAAAHAFGAIDVELLTFDALLAAGPATWHAVDAAVDRLVAGDATLPCFVDPSTVRPRLAWTVADYVDGYGCLAHVQRVGRLFRPGADPEPAAWRHLPQAYHGRAGSVVVSGTPIKRPRGVLAAGQYEPCRQLDFELEVGVVVGVGSHEPVRPDAIGDHVFGLVLVNDWSARDIQRFEYQPLGPMLGKSFATSVSAWIVPWWRASFTDSPPQHPRAPDHLRAALPWGLDATLRSDVNGASVSTVDAAPNLYWTLAQQLAHVTSNGAPLRTGDLIASGTVSGPGDDECGCLLERGDGRFLADGDTVTLTGAFADGQDLGPVTGTIEGA